MTLPILIFAAGFGTRMGALTKDTPKPMLKVGGIPMVDRAIEFARQAGCSPIVVNTHYLAQKLENHLSARWGEQVLVTHEPELLDTGGGLKAAAKLMNSDAALTLNADTVWGQSNPLVRLLADWEPARMDALMLFTPVETALAYTRDGDFFLRSGVPERRGAAPKAPYIYAGAQIIKLAELNRVSEPVFSLNKVWDQVPHLRATLYEDRWIDVGTPEGLAIANQAVLEGDDV